MSALKRMHGQLLRTMRRAGWAGMLGVLLAIAAVLVYFGGHAYLENRHAALATERVYLARSLAVTETRPDAPRAGGVVGFYARFPALAELPRTLTRLHFLADKHAIEHERTDYRSRDEVGTPLLRVTLNLPVRGDFGQMYSWLGEAQAELQELALETISIRQSDDGPGVVEAELVFVVFVRRPS